jgi:hypothetical protein
MKNFKKYAKYGTAGMATLTAGNVMAAANPVTTAQVQDAIDTITGSIPAVLAVGVAALSVLAVVAVVRWVRGAM